MTKEELHEGLNIFMVSPDTKREDMPKDVRMMLELIDSVVANTVRICDEGDTSLSVLPCVFLHAMNKVLPPIIQLMMETSGKESAQVYLDHLKKMVDGSFKI